MILVLSLYSVCIKIVEPLKIKLYGGHCAALEELNMRTQSSYAKNRRFNGCASPKCTAIEYT